MGLLATETREASEARSSGRALASRPRLGKRVTTVRLHEACRRRGTRPSDGPIGVAGANVPAAGLSLVARGLSEEGGRVS